MTINANLGEAYTIVLSSEISINSLTLSISQATLDLQADMTIAATMNQTSGRLSGDGDLVVEGELAWRGGRMEGSGTTFANGGMVITGGAGSSGNNKVLDQRRLVIPGGQTAVHNGNRLSGSNGAVLEIKEGAVLDITVDNNFRVMDAGDGGATILNAGTINKSQGTTFPITIEWDLENSGLLSLAQQDAELRWWGSLMDQSGRYIVELGLLSFDLPASDVPYVFTPDSRLLAGVGAWINLGARTGDGSSISYELQGSVEMFGTFSVRGTNTAIVTIPATANLFSLGEERLLVGGNRGQLFVEVTEPVSVGDLSVGFQGRLEMNSSLTVTGDYAQENSSSAVVSDFDITVEGELAWSGGRMEGAGVLFANGGVMVTGGAGSASNNKTLDQKRLVIPSGQTMEIAGNRLTGSNGAILDIREGGLLDITAGNNSRVMDVGEGGATILNAGTILKSQGTTFQINIEWDLVNSGLLSLAQQDADLRLWRSALIDEGGQYIVEQGLLSFDLGPSETPYVFTPDSRLLAGAGARINLGNSTSDGSSVNYELQGSVEMFGTFSVRGSNTAIATIPATASLVSLGDEMLIVGASRGQLFVEITDPVSVGDLIVGASGRLELGSPLTVTGDYTQNSASGVVSSDFDIIIEGQLTWSGGRMEGSGRTIANGSAVMTGGGSSSTKTLSERTLVIPTGRDLVYSGSRTTGRNGAVLEIEENAIFRIDAGSEFRLFEAGEGGATIKNFGAIQKVQGTTFQIDVQWALENSGLVIIFQDEADIRFREGIQNKGTIEIYSVSAVLENDEAIINEGTIRGRGIIKGDLENTTGIVQPGVDDENTGVLTVQGSYTQSEEGVLSIKIGGTEPGTGYDRLVTNSSNLNGTLDLFRLSDFSFSEEDEIKPLTWNEGSQTGTFASIMDEEFSDAAISLQYSPDGLLIKDEAMGMPGMVYLDMPEDGAVDVPTNSELMWESAGGASFYQLQISTDKNFSTTVIDRSEIETTTYQVEDLAFGTVYFWRVRGINNAGEGAWSEPRSFRTEESVSVQLFADGCVEQHIEAERVLRSCTGEIDFSQLASLLEPGMNELQFRLFDGDVIAVASETNIEVWSEKEFSWFGKFASSNNQDIVLEVDLEEQKAFATMLFDNRPYRLDYLEGNLHAIYEVDLRGLIDEPEGFEDFEDFEEEFPEDEFDPIQPQELSKRKYKFQKSPVTGSSNHTDPVIDLLILYTQQAKDSSDTHRSMVREIRNAVNNTNVTFRNSGVNARVRLADIRSVVYNETGDSGEDLRNLRINGQHKSLDVYKAKKESGADIVGMVVSDIDDCGIAYRMDNVSTSQRERAYFIVRQGFCLGNNLTFAHEIGHIMGARHDRRVSDNDGSPFDYNHGFVNPRANWPIPGSDSLDWAKQWRTVMAYNDACEDEGENCWRAWNWSNPDSTLFGDPLGIASGSLAADNVRTLNNTASTVAAFSDALPAVFGYITDVETGLPMEGVEVFTNFSSTTTNENGFYEFLVNEGTDLTITPELTGYLFQPDNAQVTDITDDVQIDFDATPLYTIQGRITKNGFPMRDIEIRGTFAPETPKTDDNGEYELLLPFDWSGVITPYSRSHTFTPESREYSELSDSLTSQNYTGELNTYTISGVIRDLTTGNFVSDVVLDGFPEEIQTNEGGFYSIELDHGWAGTVRPIKRGFNFEPFNREYSTLIADRTDNYDAFSGWLAKSDWPMFMANPQHTGTATVQPASDKVLWELQLDGAFISPAIGSDEALYIATKKGEFYIADLSGQISSNIGYVSDFTGSMAVASDNRLYIPAEGRFHRLTITSSLNPNNNFLNEEGAYFTSPVINPENGMLYTGSDAGKIYALDEEESLVWSFQTGDSVKSSPALDRDGNIYVGSDDDNIYALNPDGTQKWTYSTGGNVRSSPSIGEDGTVYIGSDDGYLYAISSSGNLEWRFSTGGAVRSTPAIDSNGNLYVGSDDGVFYAINNTGQLMWSHATGGPIQSSPAISQTRVRLFTEDLDEEVVYVGSEDGSLYAFDIISLTGGSGSRLRWKYDFGSPVNSSPILSSKGLLAGSDDGKLIAFKPVSRAWTQGVVMAQDDVPTPEDLAIMIWVDEIGGLPGVIGGNPGLDPCQGGPLIIPNCEFGGGIIGNSSPFLPVLADEELIIGLARTTSDLASILAGETTEGLLGTFSTTLPDNDATSLFFAGLTDTEGYAENPDGRPVDLQMFSKSGLDQGAVVQPDQTAVYAGHFSTDSPAMNINLSGPVDKTFSSMRFGDISEMETVPAGNYQVSLEVLDVMGKVASNEELTFELDLTGSAGEPVAIVVNGFLNPEANRNGPSLAVKTVSGNGSEPTGVASDRPVRVSLHGNYPNPFNPSTSIPFDLKDTGAVRIDIYNIAGQKVMTLIDEVLRSGSHVIPFDASGLASGVYIYRMVTDSYVESRKMVLVK
ncbi:MAG: PQQ-binding-like beta-propeller repeat protein [Cyclonatronaceae bacterium]